MPPEPVQEMPKVVGFAVRAPDCAEPEVRLPVLKPPTEVQEVAFVEDQVRVVVWPVSTVEGEAESEAVGTSGQIPVVVAQHCGGLFVTGCARLG